MGFVANMTSLVQYFLMVMHFDLETAANTLTNFMGSAFLLSLLGGFLSDTYINRFTNCLIFGLLEILVRFFILPLLIMKLNQNNQKLCRIQKI